MCQVLGSTGSGSGVRGIRFCGPRCRVLGSIVLGSGVHSVEVLGSMASGSVVHGVGFWGPWHHVLGSTALRFWGRGIGFWGQRLCLGFSGASGSGTEAGAAGPVCRFI